MNVIPAARSAMLTGQIDVTDGTLSLGLFVGYTFDPSHEFLDDVGTPADAVLVADVEVVDGEVFGTFGEFASPGTGDPVNALWYFLDTGTPSTSRLVSLVDRYADGTSLIVPRPGTSITLPAPISNRLFALGSPV